MGDYYRTEYDSLPDFLGGIYDADQYNLVIYVVGDLTDGKILLNKMLGRTDFNVKPALFSYRHLRRMNDSILSFTMREKNKNIRKRDWISFFVRYQRRKIGFLCIWMIVTIYPSPNLKNISQMIVALYLGNMKMIVLLSLISTVCSCVHKNADKEV